MIRKVVDSNFLRTNELKEYLSQSSGNFVVLADYVAMEAYKGEMPASIYASMDILTRYPERVIVLKGTQDVCALDGHVAASPERLIDVTQTREFPQYCRDLIAAKRGDHVFESELLALGREAAAQIDKVLLDMGYLASGIDAAAQVYSEQELKIIRNRTRYTEKLSHKVMHNFMLFALEAFRTHPSAFTKGPEVCNTFIFRFTLCIYVLTLKWISVGGARKTKPEKLRNDMVDANLAAFATYFDGPLTADVKFQEIYATANFLLREVLVLPSA